MRPDERELEPRRRESTAGRIASTEAVSAGALDRRRFLLRMGGWGSALAASAFWHADRTFGAQATDPLRIVSVDAYPVRLRTGTLPAPPVFESDHDPRRWRHDGPFAQLVGAVVVIIRTDQGATGFGLGGGGAAGAMIVERHLRHLLVGADPRNIELLWDQMYTSGGSYGRRGLFVMALSGVDNALWDILGKVAGQPVYRLLGGATKEKVPAYFTSREPKRGLELGFEHFKVPLREGVMEGPDGMRRIEERLREARRTIGARRSLMIDCRMRWNDVDYTLEMAKRLEPLDLRFIEEPLAPDDVWGYARLVRELKSTAIASGEHEYTQHGFRMLLHHQAVEVVQPDVSWSGGVTALRRIASMVEARGLSFMPHRGGSLYGLPLVLSSPGSPLAESFGTGEPGTDLMHAMTAPFEDGYYLLPRGPGFGAELTEELVRGHLMTA